jgi:hypothetical protein
MLRIHVSSRTMASACFQKYATAWDALAWIRQDREKAVCKGRKGVQMDGRTDARPPHTTPQFPRRTLIDSRFDPPLFAQFLSTLFCFPRGVGGFE